MNQLQQFLAWVRNVSLCNNICLEVKIILTASKSCATFNEGGVRVRGDAVLRCFWCGFSEFFFLTCGIAVFQDCAVCGNLKF